MKFGNFSKIRSFLTNFEAMFFWTQVYLARKSSVNTLQEKQCIELNPIPTGRFREKSQKPKKCEQNVKFTPFWGYVPDPGEFEVFQKVGIKEKTNSLQHY